MGWNHLPKVNLDALLLALAITELALIACLFGWAARRRYRMDDTPSPIFNGLCAAALALFVLGTLAGIAQDANGPTPAACSASQC